MDFRWINIIIQLKMFTCFRMVMFEEYMTFNIPNITSDAMTRAKDEQFAEWCKNYINDASES
ncbi:unnamed protein product [Thlaspi arvense]|uniref:Uncharacterized protein n=1 Tax=Thlaspi arvense TaxID=13288 RepID=A0AAU9STX9_THLAR|nr:unnamed protein product [Thlaspi arvense]